MISCCIKKLKNCLEKDDIVIQPDEISIAFVGKNLEFSLIDSDVLSSAVEKDDYSLVRNYFKPMTVSSLVWL